MFHQIAGLVAMSLILAVLLRGWGLSRRTASAVGGLGLAATLLLALAGTGHRVEPGLLPGPGADAAMPPLPSLAAPPAVRSVGLVPFFP